jgi:hypothetical protein
MGRDCSINDNLSYLVFSYFSGLSLFSASLRLCEVRFFSLARSLYSLKPQRSRRGTAQQHSWFVPYFASQTVSFAVSCVFAAWVRQAWPGAPENAECGMGTLMLHSAIFALSAVKYLKLSIELKDEQ